MVLAQNHRGHDNSVPSFLHFLDVPQQMEMQHFEAQREKRVKRKTKKPHVRRDETTPL